MTLISCLHPHSQSGPVYFGRWFRRTLAEGHGLGLKSELFAGPHLGSGTWHTVQKRSLFKKHWTKALAGLDRPNIPSPTFEENHKTPLYPLMYLFSQE